MPVYGLNWTARSSDKGVNDAAHPLEGSPAEARRWGFVGQCPLASKPTAN